MDYVPQLAKDLGWDDAVKNLDPDETKASAPTYRVDFDKGGVKDLIHNSSKSKLSVPKDLELKYDQGKYYVFCRSANIEKTSADDYMRITPSKGGSSADMTGQDAGQTQLAITSKGVLTYDKGKTADVTHKLAAALQAQVDHYSNGTAAEQAVAAQAAKQLRPARH